MLGAVNLSFELHFVTVETRYGRYTQRSGKLNDEADFVNKIIKLQVAKTNKK